MSNGHQYSIVTIPERKEQDVLDLARMAICSIGSFDRDLQNHYQHKLDTILLMSPGDSV